ncbi:MAG TPA: cytochrome c oxidase subunit II [Gaiellaceae bacterium]|nr:cytochrome c oxidase subunit II [Gaiellaceae bacterium]
MRRKLPALLFVVVAVLATAGVAAAANGGFGPQYAHSPNAHRINSAYWLIFGFTSFIFVLVETLLVVFVWKYRSRGRGRDVEGAQVHGHTRLELLWTAFPVVVLAVIAAFVFYKLPGISNVPAASAGNRVDVTVEGHQFYWLYRYPNGAVSINDLHVPVGAVTDVKIVSADVAHSFWIPQLGGKTDAIPGRTNHTWFQPDRTGVFQGQCAEFCGLYHEAMRARVISESQDAYDAYVSKTAPATLGKQEWQGVCATCHGMQGEGGYGPAIADNPILTQRASLARTVRDGVDTPRAGQMPPVGNTWDEQQIDALAAYVGKHVFKGATSGS